ncbi:MAG: MobA/MobL family protein [Firmicutes bacterium]|nr:MobA/MobL family protein [Bacillota bacterium]
MVAGPEEKKEMITIKGITFVQHNKLHNVRGRSQYISSREKQENLYAVYETAPAEYWRDLAKENRADFTRSGTAGTCIEAREFIIALPKYMTGYDPEELLRYFTESFKREYGAECTAALHHNKSRTNYHIHLIYSERKMLDEPVRKIASRNMFFDPKGKRVRTKKEATDEQGLLPGYRMVPKGEIYEEHLFEKKNPLFKQKNFTENAKEFFTELINEQLPEQLKMRTFPKNGPYLPTKKIGKNNPYAEEIQKTNQLKDEWNKGINKAKARGVSKDSLMSVKQELIVKPVGESVRKSGSRRDPVTFRNILANGVKILTVMLKELHREGPQVWEKAWGDALDSFMKFCKQKLTRDEINTQRGTDKGKAR